MSIYIGENKRSNHPDVYNFGIVKKLQKEYNDVVRKLDHQTILHVKKLLHLGKKIQAIKDVREKYNIGLKNAKHIVDMIEIGRINNAYLLPDELFEIK